MRKLSQNYFFSSSCNTFREILTQTKMVPYRMNNLCDKQWMMKCAIWMNDHQVVSSVQQGRETSHRHKNFNTFLYQVVFKNRKLCFTTLTIVTHWHYLAFKSKWNVLITLFPNNKLVKSVQTFPRRCQYFDLYHVVCCVVWTTQPSRQWVFYWAVGE